MATKPPTTRNARLATTRKLPTAEGPKRAALVARYVAGVVLIAAAFVVVPKLGLAAWLRWTLGGVGFVVGNLVRPLYRAPVRKKDERFASALEIIHFLLVAIALAAIGLVLFQFSAAQVTRALLDPWVLICAAAFFALVGLRDLMHRWREG